MFCSLFLLNLLLVHGQWKKNAYDLRPVAVIYLSKRSAKLSSLTGNPCRPPFFHYILVMESFVSLGQPV